MPSHQLFLLFKEGGCQWRDPIPNLRFRRPMSMMIYVIYHILVRVVHAIIDNRLGVGHIIAVDVMAVDDVMTL